MWIKKSDIKKLSYNIRKIIDGKAVDLRDNREGVWNILKNDIHTLANQRNEQMATLQNERDAMKDILADISHQLKTPLTSMTIMADLLDDAPPEKQSEFISNIQIGLNRMDWLVSALLKMARIDAGAIVFSKKRVQTREIIDLAIEPLKIMLEIKNQVVEILGEAEIFCDKRWAAEALTNIIKNASEHSPENGLIQIEAGSNPICKWISVTDSGEGVPPAKIMKLFRRFEGSQSEKGYGIGLPLALAIVRSQSGDIEVKGTTFTLKFFK